MDSYSIPIDLIIEIFSRLPSKSVARFHCVSKLWASIFVRPYFTELFLTRSSAKPRLLFAITKNDSRSFFSMPQRQNPYEKSSTLVVAAESRVKFPQCSYRYQREMSCGYASGLMYFYYCNPCDDQIFICNPNTGLYATLPCLKRRHGESSCSFFVFEPIDKQYKVLFIMASMFGLFEENKIITLGAEDMSWRTIKCSLNHDVKSKGICINGVLYYLAETLRADNKVIVCFDVRSEKITYIHVESLCELINYKGKLCAIYWEDDVDAAAINKLCMWVLEDVEKQKWSQNAYTLSDDKFSRRHISVAGVTASGEIVFSMREYISIQPFYVFYFNPERNHLQRVEILGFGETLKEHGNVYTFVDHVEDLNVINPKLLKSAHTPFV